MKISELFESPKSVKQYQWQPERYLYFTPIMSGLILPLCGLALLQKEWLVTGLFACMLVTWLVIVPIIILHRLKAQFKPPQPLLRRRPSRGGNGEASSGVPLIPLPPSRSPGASKLWRAKPENPSNT